VGGYCAHCQSLRALELERARQHGLADAVLASGVAPGPGAPHRPRAKRTA